MITEDYVSFETAKLLKEKGFDWEESPFYCEQDRDEWRQKNNYTVPNPHYDPEVPFDTETSTMIAPHVSLQMAMKWLREVHKIYMYAAFDGMEEVWFSRIYDKDKHLKDLDDFNTYEEACEAAIKYCLENLI